MFEAYNETLAPRVMHAAICECNRAITWIREQSPMPVKVTGTLPDNPDIAYTVINATWIDEFQCVVYQSDRSVCYARYVVEK